MNKLTLEEKQSLKARGILNQKQEEFYAIRFLSKAGYFKAYEIEAISKIAKTYGNGEISLTSRLTIEVPFIREENINRVLLEAKENNLRIGGAGKTVRAVVSCKGSVCKHGLYDTREMAENLEEEFLGRAVPSKFKIGVFGCLNSYGKAQSNDFAILPSVNTESKEVEFLVFIGGRAGKKSRKAEPMERRFKKEEIIPLLDKVIKLFNELALKKERLAEVIERLGYYNFEKELLKKLA